MYLKLCNTSRLTVIKCALKYMLKYKEKYRLRDFNNYMGLYQGQSHDLAYKSIDDLTRKEISYLLREDKFTDTLLEISDKLLENEKIEIFGFHHQANSDEQRELIRELVIIKDDYWDLYPRIYRSIKSKLEKHLPIIKLPEYIKDHFRNYEPKTIKWGIEENGWYENMINENAASTVLAAYRRIGQLKRAIKLNTTIQLEAFGRPKALNSEEMFNQLLVNKLINADQLKKYIKEDDTVYSK